MKLCNKLLKIEGEACGTRIVSNLFKIGDNYIFLDIGWTGASSNPVHWIGKLISEDNGKMIFRDDSYPDEPEPREYFVTEITKEDKDQFGSLLIDQANKWNQWETDNGIDENKAKDAIRKEFDLGNVDIY